MKEVSMFRLALAVLLIPALADAAPPGGDVRKANTGPLIPSGVVEKQVAKLTTQVEWHSSLDEAKTLAQKQHKLIFFLHALGDLDGDT
jgi:hypothetical protein